MLIISGCNIEKTSTQLDPTVDFLMNMDKKCMKMLTQYDDTNRSLEISIMEMSENSLKLDTDIYFWVENTTEKAIRFPADMNVQVFQCINGTWVDVQLGGNYLGDSFDLSETSFFSTLTGFSIKPILEVIEQENLMRIYIEGEVVKNDKPTDKFVAADMYFVIRP